MQNFAVIIIVLTILIGLLAIADRLKLPAPVFLVMAGLTIGFVPSLPTLVLNPEVVFLLFLPPILYDAASHTSWHEFKADIKPISILAVALVFFTTTAVAIACYYFIPGFTWPLAFVLGAIVSPPDAVAATSITKGLGLNKRVITILEGESLVNDASALIAFRFAVAAIGTGSFVLWRAGLDFLIVAAGGILCGALIAYIFIMIHKRILNNSIISTSLTLLTPFISYMAAEYFHTSGVLAVVATGLMISWRASETFSYQTRIRTLSVWDTVIFLLNGFIFILIGLQLPAILEDVAAYDIRQLIFYGLIVSVVTIVVRILWVFGAAYSPFLSRRKNGEGDPDTWKNVMIVAWTGTRGVVSLATALSLPLTFANGSAFPHRSLILFLAFAVIFTTLVVQGLSLPLLVRLLGVKPHHNRKNEEESELRLLMANSVINFVEHELPVNINEQLKDQIKNHYIDIADSLSKYAADTQSGEVQEKNTSPQLSARLAINRFQRQLLIRLHKEGTFSQNVIRRLEQELDNEELQLSRQSKKTR